MKLFSLHLTILFAFALTACGSTQNAGLRPTSHPFLSFKNDQAETPIRNVKKTVASAQNTTSKSKKNEQSQQSSQQTQNSRAAAKSQKRAASNPPKHVYTSDADRDLAQDRRSIIKRNLDRIQNQKIVDGQQICDRVLVQTVFGDLSLDSQPETRSISELRKVSRARKGTPKLGDLIFFEAGGNAPEVGILRSAHGSNYEVVAVTRGAARIVYLDLDNPHERRVNGRVANSFLRAPKRQDPKGTAYLAGGLFREARTLLD